MRSLTGALLGGTYRVGECLGQGGMGAVYEAVHEGLGRRVAIKVLLDQGQIGAEALTRFQREAMAAAQLGHPNIIQVTDFRSNPGEPPFIVMERLEGESMEHAIRREGRLAPARVSRIAQQVLEALIVAHQAGIVHRDIKPANLFLTQIAGVGEVVKVIDFGIAKLQTQGTNLTAAGASMGTPLYAAPELLWGTQSDARADIYSLGATMYHALTGRPPIMAETLPQFMSQVRDTFPEPVHHQVPGLDSQLSQAVMFALAKEPGSRYSSATAMRDALQGGARISISGDGSGTAQTAQVPPMQAMQMQSPMTPMAGAGPGSRSSTAPHAALAQSFAGTPQPYTYPSGPPGAQSPQPGFSPSYAAPPPHQPQHHSMHSAPQKKSSAGLWLGLGGLALLLVFGGGGAALWFLVLAPDSKPAVAAVATSAASASGAASGPAASLPASPSVDPSGRSVLVIPPPPSSRGVPPTPNVPTAPTPTSPTPTPTTPPAPNNPATGKRMVSARCGPSSTGSTYDDATQLRAAFASRQAQITQCGMSACYNNPPSDRHENDNQYWSANYTVQVAKSGAVTSVAPMGSDSCLPLDGCIRTSVLGAGLPPPVKPGSITMSCYFVRTR